jgi:SAM-dependent methyltransferase
VIVHRDERRGRAASFAAVADAYERGRPGYPVEAVAWLTGERPLDVVDLGAGTGKLTRSLVELGHHVTAVEPLPEMLALLRAAAQEAVAVAGSAERIPLPDESSDVVVAAQAFHWFDHVVAMPEIARVLRPGGRLALVWNTRDDRDPWVARLSDTIMGRETVQDSDALEPLTASRLFRPVETATFAFEQVLERSLLRDLVVSRSYCAMLPPAEREQVLERVDALYDQHARPDGIRIPYLTECFRAAKR